MSVKLLSITITSLFLGTLACTTLPPAEKTGKVNWQYRGMEQLKEAKDLAAQKKKLVLIGLSGSPG